MRLLLASCHNQNAVPIEEFEEQSPHSWIATFDSCKVKMTRRWDRVVWTLVILQKHPAFSQVPSPLPSPLPRPLPQARLLLLLRLVQLQHRLRRLPISRQQHLVNLPQSHLLLLLRLFQLQHPLRRLPISRLQHLVHLPQASLLLLPR
jgi:hypothetical protein